MNKKMDGFFQIFKIIVLASFFSIALTLLSGDKAYCLKIDSQNVQAIAIYGETSGFGIGLQSDQIVFNITDRSLITGMISSIDFSVERDCSDVGSLGDAGVYIKFNDGSVEVYALYDLWSHFSKDGLQGSCYFVSEQGQNLFMNSAQ